MSRRLIPDFKSLLAGKVRLPASVAELRKKYQEAAPFSHLVLDDIFPPQTLDALLAEMAAMDRAQWVDVAGDPRERTVRMRSAVEIGEAGERFLGVVHSAAFLYLLSEITGIGQLLPDPYLQGGGFAVMRRGDYFEVHADRNVAYDTGLTRRLAMIVFLNKSWKPEYHGQLELWTSDARRCEVRVDPLFNKTILFEVAYPNYHGVPEPLACPSDRTRQSFIVYFHTAEIPEKSGVNPHTTIFAPHFYGASRSSVRSVVRDVTPPFLMRLIRKIFN